MRKFLALGAAVLAGAVVLALPTPAGLSAEGHRMAALFAVTLLLWITEAVPIAVTSLAALALQPLFRVATLQTAFTSSISTVFFFVIAMFCIAQAFTASGLDRRFALWLLAKAGTDSRRVLFAFMAGTATLSTIVSDVPCTALFMAIALAQIEKMGLRPLESNFAKALMMGIPIAAFVGGVGTPAGTSINILGLSFLEQYGKVTIPFLHWMAIGIPMVVLLLPVSWWALIRFYPPEMASIGAMEDIHADRARLGPIQPKEIKVLALVGGMVLLWILSTWFKSLDVALVALLGAVAMFLPGMNLFTWKEVQHAIGWDVLLMIGGVTSLGAASAKTGLAQWLVGATLGGLPQSNIVALIALISTFTVLIHLVLPIAPVIVAVVIPPIVLLAQAAGVNPALYALPVIFTASCAFLLPLDAVTLVTYSRGYYRMLDMVRPGLVISLAWIVLMTALMALLGRPLGLF